MISDLAFTSLVSFISLLHSHLYHLSLILTLSVYEVEKLKYIGFSTVNFVCCGNVEKHRVFPQFHKRPSVTRVLKLIPTLLESTLN